MTWISLLWFLAFLLLIYGLLLFILALYWRKQRPLVRENKAPFVSVSVLIPVRNEASNIIQCLNSLENQSLPTRLWEVMVIDDHSSDDSKALVEAYRKKSEMDLKIISLPEASEGKKAALAKGIEQARFPFVLTTDADCSLPEKWVETYAVAFSRGNIKFVAGPVAFWKREGIFQRLQELDLWGMIGLGATLFSAGLPVLSNGANLGFDKESFKQLGGYDNMPKSPSGDDVFLLHAFKKHFKGQFLFLKSQDSLVHTQPCDGFSELIQQRFRWASKARFYQDLTSRSISLFFALLYATLFLAMVISHLVDLSLLWHFYTLLFVKFLIDLHFMYRFTAFFGKIYLLPWLLPMQLIYPLYIFVITIFAPFTSFEWKGRSSNKTR